MNVPLKPVVKEYWRKGNSLAMIASAKQRLNEMQRFDQSKQLSQETEGLTDYDQVIEVISKYCTIH